MIGDLQKGIAANIKEVGRAELKYIQKVWWNLTVAQEALALRLSSRRMVFKSLGATVGSNICFHSKLIGFWMCPMVVRVARSVWRIEPWKMEFSG